MSTLYELVVIDLCNSNIISLALDYVWYDSDIFALNLKSSTFSNPVNSF